MGAPQKISHEDEVTLKQRALQTTPVREISLWKDVQYVDSWLFCCQRKEVQGKIGASFTFDVCWQKIKREGHPRRKMTGRVWANRGLGRGPLRRGEGPPYYSLYAEKLANQTGKY